MAYKTIKQNTWK